jgi:hypothetical protein
MKKDNFIFYLEWLRTMEAAMLSKNERSRLIEAIVLYADTGKIPELPRLLMAIFAPIKTTMDNNAEKYEAIASRNRSNGAKGGRPKGAEKPKKTQENPVGYSGLSQKTQKTQWDEYVNDNDNVFVNDAGMTAPDEKEKYEIYLVFFWRNFSDPEAELNRFVDYNAKRKWKALDTPTKRMAAAAEWQPQDSKPRVRQEFLDMWYRLYCRLKKEGEGCEMAMIDCMARFEFQGNEAKLRSRSPSFRRYIEEQRPPEIMEYIGNLRLTTAAP